MGFTFSEVVENALLNPNIVSPEVLEEIPSTCDGAYGCGAELEFTDNLVQLYCPNRFCTHKVAARLEAMAKEMKADGWGMSTCLEVVHKFKLISPAMVFLIEQLPIDKYPAELKVSGFQTKLSNICDRSKRRVQLWEVVKLLGVPGVSDIARKVLDGYDNIEEAFEDIEKYQAGLIADKLGLSVKSENGVLALNTYITLIEYKNEILQAVKHFDIYKPVGDSIRIAITGGVEGYSNKDDFIRHLNIELEGLCNVTLAKGVNAKLDILIVDAGDADSGKFKSATRVNEKAELTGGHKILICDHEECEAMLKEKYGL